MKINKLFSLETILLSRDINFINTMLNEANINSDQYTFKYYHLKGPHPGLILDENLKPKKMKYNRKNFKKQAKASLKITKLFLHKLKELKIFNSSLIFIIADHGSGRSEDMFIRGSFINDEVFQKNKILIVCERL